MKTTSKWMMLAALAALLVLGGCRHQKPTDTTDSHDSDTPGTDVDTTKDFGHEGPQSAEPDRSTTYDGENLTEEELNVQRQLRPVFFAFDKYDLSQESRGTLGDNSRVLRDHPKVSVWVEGHCDERGTNEYNLALGDRRSRAARDYMVAAGVDSSQMSVISYGEEKPFEAGHDEASWSQNRRAHFRVKGTGVSR